MPGSSTTPGRLDARFHAPTRVAFRIRNGVGTRDKNLCEAQWLACVLLYRRFAAALTGDCARLEADVVSYSFIVSDLHRLLVAGLPAHKVPGVREAIEARGATLRYLPQYSPDLNPIEMPFSKPEACLRRVAERTVPRLYRRIGSFARSLTAQEARDYFRHAGYA